MRYLSLFTGIGGFEKGIEQAYENILHEETAKRTGKKDQKGLRKWPAKNDHEGNTGMDVSGTVLCQHADRGSNRQPPMCVGYSEINKYAIQTYQKHYPNHTNYGDITKINECDLPDFDLLVGGFPCQSFSVAGKRGGFADTRGTLFFDIARIVKHKRPHLLLLENVKGLLSHDEGRTFGTIVSTLDELGYDLQWQVLNSKNFGVPQNRERILIVGHLRGTPRPEVFPLLGEDGGDTEIGVPYPRGAKGIATRHLDRNGGLISDIASTVQVAEVPHVVIPSPVYGSGKRSVGYSVSDTFPTIRATQHKSGDNQAKVSDGVSIRRLTPMECERIQGFPDNWTAGVSDTQRYKQCGNAVTVNVIRAVMERLLTNE